MWIKVSASWWGILPLSNCLEMNLQSGSVFCICNKVSLWYFVRGGGAFTLVVSCGDGDGTLVGSVESINAFVMLQVQVAGPSSVDAATVLMRMLAAAGLLGTLTNWDRQFAVLFHVPDIHSKVMLYLANSSDHWFTLLFMFLPLRNFCKDLWSLCMTMSDS